MPHGDGGRAGNVERVLSAVLGNLDAAVAGIDHCLAHALDLIAEDEGIFFALLNGELLKADAAVHLLNGADGVALIA